MDLAATVKLPLDFVRATRQHDMPPHISKHLTHYQEITKLTFRAGMSFEDISPSIASAFLWTMYYRPGQVRIFGEFLLLTSWENTENSGRAYVLISAVPQRVCYYPHSCRGE